VAGSPTLERLAAERERVSHPNGELLAVEMTMQRLQTDHSFPSHRPGSGDLLLATLASVMKFFTRR